MLEKVFRTGSGDEPRSGHFIRNLGIVSMAMWVLAFGGAVYALKTKKLPHALEAFAGIQPASGPEQKEQAAGKPADDSAAAEAKAEEERVARRAEASPGEIPAASECEALRQLAEIHFNRGELDKAAVPLQRLLLAPKHDLALLSMAGETFLGLGLYRAALDASQEALQAAPDRADIEAVSVTAMYRLGHVEAALKQTHAALKRHPEDPSLLVALATMEVEIGPAFPDYGKSLQAVLKLKPKYVPALYLLGRKAALEGDYHDAQLAFGKVLKIDPRHAKAHAQLGMALYHLHKNQAAEAEYRLALSLSPKDYNTWFNLGEVHLETAGQERKPAVIQTLRQEAMEAYLKAVEFNPDHAEAHFRIGVLLNGNRQYKEAVRHLEAAEKLDARHVPTLLQLAVAYENLQQPDRAKACLQKALELDPLDKVVLLKLKSLT